MCLKKKKKRIFSTIVPFSLFSSFLLNFTLHHLQHKPIFPFIQGKYQSQYGGVVLFMAWLNCLLTQNFFIKILTPAKINILKIFFFKKKIFIFPSFQHSRTNLQKNMLRNLLICFQSAPIL
jgi:hypothetical protein